MACMRNRRSKCAQFKVSGLESSSLYEKIDLLYFDLMVLATRTFERDIREE